MVLGVAGFFVVAGPHPQYPPRAVFSGTLFAMTRYVVVLSAKITTSFEYWRILRRLLRRSLPSLTVQGRASALLTARARSLTLFPSH